ncbi:thiamine diphosphokinase [Orbaceae bacterium ac157xtp]
MSKKALLFVNGLPPTDFPKIISNYDYIACTDGAYSNYLKKTSIIPHFIIGDLDSLDKNNIAPNIEIIDTPDQDKGDFEKAMLYLNTLGVTKFDIYGASGNACDHYLGILSVAVYYNKKFKMTFYDHFSQYFIVSKSTQLNNVDNKIISLIPLSIVKKVTLKGFEYPLINADLEFGKTISLRNKAINDQVSIEYESGDLAIFIEN